MKHISIKYRKPKNYRYLKVLVSLLLIPVSYFFLVSNPPDYIWSQMSGHAEMPIPVIERVAYESVQIEPPRAPEVTHVGLSKTIQQVFREVGSPLSDKIPWLVSACEERGLNPKLVVAVMAKESGWGKYCPRNNCFGWGFTDSGDLGYGGETFEDITTDILDAYAVYYNVDTAQEMANNGYNFHDEWIYGVNEIISYFN